jgi:hypothetical protein
MPDKTKILLFISKESLYFQTTMEEFQKLLKEFNRLSLKLLM